MLLNLRLLGSSRALSNLMNAIDQIPVTASTAGTVRQERAFEPLSEISW